MKKNLLSLALAFGLFLAATAAHAMTLHDARNAGILGEKNDGYVVVLKKSAEADALASDVNDKRRQEYARISKENGQPVSVVGSIAAARIVENLSPGDKYQDASGSWKTR